MSRRNLPTEHRIVGAADPETALVLRDRQKNGVDLSAGYTFEVKVAREERPKVVLVDLEVGITGADGDGDTVPSATIAWAAAGGATDTVAALAGGRFLAQLTATLTATGKPRRWQWIIILDPEVGP